MEGTINITRNKTYIVKSVFKLEKINMNFQTPYRKSFFTMIAYMLEGIKKTLTKNERYIERQKERERERERERKRNLARKSLG